MSVYINGTGLISPQKTYDNSEFLNEVTEHSTKIMHTLEPVYKNYINPIALRRMSRIMKNGVVSGIIAMRDANLDNPDAIITGTSLGCIEDTENFITAIINNNETLLTPTAFIQSTHNTVNAAIAITLKCNAYNFTHCQRSFSFENALTDSIIKLTMGDAKNILLGGFEEITENHYSIYDKLGVWKNDEISNLNLIKSGTPGTIAGEGSAFFVVSNEKKENSYCEIIDVKSLFEPFDKKEFISEIELFLKDNGKNIEEIDAVIIGINGDIRADSIYFELMDGIFSDKNIFVFKHLSGEYPTSSSFALWLAAKIFKTNSVPDIIKYRMINDKELKNILIYNQYDFISHNFILLAK